jgi:hypothetical protein
VSQAPQCQFHYEGKVFDSSTAVRLLGLPERVTIVVIMESSSSVFSIPDGALAKSERSPADDEYLVALVCGRGPPIDVVSFARNAKASADRNDSTGQSTFGYCLQNGFGLSRDSPRAAHYYRLSAEQGNALGELRFGFCLEKGFGVAVCIPDAIQYFERALRHGHVEANFALRRCRNHTKRDDRGERPFETESFFSNPSRLPSNNLRNFSRQIPLKQLAVRESFQIDLFEDPENHSQTVVKMFHFSKSDPTERIAKELAILTEVRLRCFPRFVCWSPPFFEGRDEVAGQIGTEFCPNGSLDKVLELVRFGKVPSFWTHTNIAKLIVGTAIGLGHLHSLGIVHTDVKPENLLIDSEFQVRINGFSKARVDILQEQVRTHEPTPLYSAPEMFDEKQKKTGKVDVFSFAVIVLEILIGSASLREGSSQAICALWEVSANSAIKMAIERCWSRRPDDRPSFDEVVADFRTGEFKVYPDVDSNEVDLYTKSLCLD